LGNVETEKREKKSKGGGPRKKNSQCPRLRIPLPKTGINGGRTLS